MGHTQLELHEYQQSFKAFIEGLVNTILGNIPCELVKYEVTNNGKFQDIKKMLCSLPTQHLNQLEK